MITVQRQNLLRTVERVAKFSDARSSMPALACVRIEWTGNTLHLTATNLTAHAVASVAGTGADAAWSALAYAKELIKALKSLPGDEIGIDKEGLQIEICASGCAIKVAGVDPSVWPKLTPPAQDLHPVNSAALADSLLSVLPATSTDETRGHLMTVHVESDGADRTVFVTTDGHRLDHIVRHDVCMPPTDAEGVSLPGPEISIVARLIRPTYPVRWGWHEGHVTIELGGLLCVLRLVNVQFPPYHQVIPDASSHAFRIADVSEWIQATQAMASMAEEHFVTLGIGADVSAVRMTALGRGYDGKAYRDLPIRDVRVSAADKDAEGEGPGPFGPFISCNGTYLAHALQIAGDDLEIGICRPVDPILIRSRSEGAEITSVLMPVRCDEAPADRFPTQPVAREVVSAPVETVRKGKTTAVEKASRKRPKRTGADKVRQDAPQASAVAAGQDAPESSPVIPSLPTVQDAPQASQSAPIVSLAPYQAPRVEIVAPTALTWARDASTDDHGLSDAWTAEPEPDDLTRQVRRKVGRQRLYTCACNPHHAETVKGYVRSRGECDLCESTDGIEFHDYGTPGWHAALALMAENARLDAQLAAQVREASRERLATAMVDRRRGILRSV